MGVMDIGCGNGRNVKYLRKQGYTNTVAFDMVNDYGYKITLGQENFPLLDNSVSVILANYVFMFLNKTERTRVIRELKRVAKTKCTLMVELYPAKDSFTVNEEECEELKQELMDAFGWQKVLCSKGRFVVRNNT